VLIAHNELGHDPVDGTDYDGKPARMCPLYPGVTCREHVDAAVDLETERDDELTPVPFIELCPNSWLVPPQGEPIRIVEDDQFVVGKIEAQVEKVQKTLGPSVSRSVHDQVVNALGQADQAIEDEAWPKALQALAGIAAHVKKAHRGLEGLIDARIAEIDERVGWAFEELAEGDGPLAARRKAVEELVKALDVAVYGRKPKLLATMQAWLEKAR